MFISILFDQQDTIYAGIGETIEKSYDHVIEQYGQNYGGANYELDGFKLTVYEGEGPFEVEVKKTISLKKVKS